jgi:acetylornithine deacetylase
MGLQKLNQSPYLTAGPAQRDYAVETTPDILSRLVAFNSVSRNPNETLIAFIASRLRECGARVRVLPGAMPGKANLLASLGPEGRGGIVLSGHSDVVPVDGQDWATDPFVLTAREDRLHGRGSSDMKGFIAAAIALAARLAGNTLSQPLHIAVSHDEETGCIGVRTMLATLAGEGFAARGCIIGEPTGLRAATGHKGKIAGCICCRGQAAHSANPELGSNAISLAAGMVGEIRDLQEWLKARGAQDAAYAVPYSTLHVGMIAGGTALNIVPEACDIEFEIRFLPGDAPAALLARLAAAGDRLAAPERARGRSASVQVIQRNRYPGLETPADSAIVALACAAAGNPSTYKAGFGSEAGLFNDVLGLPAVVCGPGSIDRAHKPDEYITKSELESCDAFLDGIAAALAVPVA